MADCELTFSTFSAGQQATALNMRKGWKGRVADQLVGGKRYVGRTASAAATEPTLNITKGHHSIIVDDCDNDCKVYGSTYSAADDGKLKGRAQIETSITAPCSSWLFFGNDSHQLLLEWNVPNFSGACPSQYNQALNSLTSLGPVPFFGVSQGVITFFLSEDNTGACLGTQNLIAVNINPTICQVTISGSAFASVGGICYGVRLVAAIHGNIQSLPHVFTIQVVAFPGPAACFTTGTLRVEITSV